MIAGRALAVDGRRLLGYAEYGDPAGTPVVSFHGWPGSRVQTTRYDEAARALGVRLIAPERSGVGLSDRRADPSLRSHVFDVIRLADALGIGQFGVLGVSGGGPYALAAAAWLGERVCRVALVSALSPGSMGATPVIRATGWLGLHAAWVFVPGFGAAARFTTRHGDRAVDLAFRTLPPCDRAIVDQPAIRRLSASDAREAFRQGGRGMRDDALALLAPPAFALGDITTPVHLWHGDADTIVPIATGREVAAAVPDCDATFLPGEGHYLAIPRAGEVLAVFREWTSPPALSPAGRGGVVRKRVGLPFLPPPS